MDKNSSSFKIPEGYEYDRQYVKTEKAFNPFDGFFTAYNTYFVYKNKDGHEIELKKGGKSKSKRRRSRKNKSRKNKRRTNRK
jgi:hypothetical protein